MSNNIRTRDGGVFNFVDGLKVKNIDLEDYVAGPSATNLTTTVTATTVNINSSTGGDASIPTATSTEAGVMSAADKVKLSGIDLTAKQDTLVSGTNIKTINGTSLLGSGDISVSGGSSEYYVFESNDSNSYNVPETEYVITRWSLLASSGSSVTTNGVTFTVPAGTWMVSCSVGIMLPPNIGIYSRFRANGTPSGLTQITGSAVINGTDTTSYATSTGNGIVFTPILTSMSYAAIASGVFNLNPDNFAHRVTFMKI